jgi:hypothetical protein
VTRSGTALALALLTFLTYYLFPGHTYLTQDSQIYVPILEHLWDPSALPRDILVERPHVAFTIYDEVALSLRWAAHASFHQILAAQQIVFRGLGLWGIYLIALATLASGRLALLVAAIFSLGAEVAGPAVLVTEYEPTPRAFAVPLLFLAVGLIAHRRYTWAGIAASVAFLYHPPSVYPFWILYFAVALWPGKPVIVRHHLYGLLPLLGASAVLLAASHWQSGMKENQEFLARITPEIEMLQRMRAPYNWVSLWWQAQWAQYLAVSAAAYFAIWRLRRQLTGELRIFLAGLPLVGILSVPVSYVLLDRLKWGLMPQLQPARALLFVVAIAVLASAMAACVAVRERRWVEAFAWFAFVYLMPMHGRVDAVPPLPYVAVTLGLAILACAGAAIRSLTPAAALAAFAAIPFLAHAQNYAILDTPDLRALSTWAAAATPRDSVFSFPGPPKNLEPGVFRSEALRAVYADWKGGGQVNYLKDLGEEWWRRYQATIQRPFSEADLPRYATLGIDYVVLPQPLFGRPPVFANSRYRVYATRR